MEIFWKGALLPLARATILYTKDPCRCAPQEKLRPG